MYEYCFLTKNLQIFFKDYRKWEQNTRAKPLLWATPHHKTGISSNTGEIRPCPTGKSGISVFMNSFVISDQVTSKTKYNIKELMLLIKSRKEAIKDLEELCEQLQERNLQMARSIMDTDRSSFARTNELLIQTEQKRVSEIALFCSSMIMPLCTQRGPNVWVSTFFVDMEFPVKGLQIADMERKLDRLKEMEQKHASHFPSIVKLMASQNDTMREEIHKQKRLVMEMERKNEELRKCIRELQLSRPKNLRREIFPDVFLKSDK
uniref:Uncharacterized protein n=1 Tax=Cyprinus carpio TaxID=7962 RepID=A0A8C2EP53_CYPCA